MQRMEPKEEGPVPAVRAVESEERILSREARKFLLRCHPCADMPNILLSENAEDEIDAAKYHKTASTRDIGCFPPEWFLG
jgi:hypothetical protein